MTIEDRCRGSQAQDVPAQGDDPSRAEAAAGARGIGAPADPGRRRLLGGAAAVAGVALVPQAAAAAARLRKGWLPEAEALAGLELTSRERELMMKGLEDQLEAYAKLRAVPLPNGVAPAVRFDPRVATAPVGAADRGAVTLPDPGTPRPASEDDLAFAGVAELAGLLRRRAIGAVELTNLYLERIRRYDPTLHAVITLTAERALEGARRADAALASGQAVSPLAGIPWGAKDLLAARGYPTTWGSVPFRNQSFDLDATVVERLEAAGAPLVAKTAVGELAWGDVWFDATTRNPWKLTMGSSGSSAGSAAATAAGLVGFAIGTETWGSIVSPCTVCGVSGLRPTFGRVSRHGVMALSWTMDKIGPIARNVADLAAVFAAIHGPDGQDFNVVGKPFTWDATRSLRGLRIGYLKAAFESEPGDDDEKAMRPLELASLETLREMGVELIPIELPALPIDAMAIILTAEASTAFDELTRSGRDDQLVRQEANAWPNVFREGRFIPSPEYLMANRVRTLAMQQMAEVFRTVDVYVAPSWTGPNLLLTNLTGHPQLVVPNGLRADGLPSSISFVGDLDGEDRLLTVGHAYQQATDHHRRRPALSDVPTPPRIEER